MAIQFLQTVFAGQVGVEPRLVRLVCNDNYSTIITENYLQDAAKDNPIQPTDFIFCAYANNSFQMFTPVITSSSITLSPWPAQASDIQSKSNLYYQNLTWAGGGTINAFAITGVTTSSVIQAEIKNSANACSILSCKVLTPDFVTIQFSADPGTVVIAFNIAFTPQT